MNCRTHCPKSTAKRSHAGFTLAEVLAAMMFMAIVIPVAVAALRTASQVGVVSTRKAVACRIAERVLNEAVVTETVQKAYQTGTVREQGLNYTWTLNVEPSGLETLREATVKVTFPVQGRDYDVSLTTLVDISI